MWEFNLKILHFYQKLSYNFTFQYVINVKGESERKIEVRRFPELRRAHRTIEFKLYFGRITVLSTFKT